MTTDLGRCMDGWCDRPAVVYIAGPYYGESPRITIIAGPRAAQLASGGGVTNLRCIECALFAVERVAFDLTAFRTPEPTIPNQARGGTP